MSNVNPELYYRRLWLVAGYSIVAMVIYLSVTSVALQLHLDFPYQDKISHLLAYFTMMAWFIQIYHVRKHQYYFAIAFIIMGTILEYIQSFDPARYSEVGDMVANMLGVIIGFVLIGLTSLRYTLFKLESILRKK